MLASHFLLTRPVNRGGGMDFQETITTARDAITVKRVYGEPIDPDG